MDIVPIGSIVYTKGSLKKLMIVARTLFREINGEKKYFDYGACFYPEGLLDSNVIYFNKEDIESVFKMGFSDSDNEELNRRILEWEKQTKIKKGKIYDLLIGE